MSQEQKDSRAQVSLPPEKIQLTMLASASVQPFAEVFWQTVQGDRGITILLLNLLSHLQEEKQYGQLFEVLRILHGAFSSVGSIDPETLNLTIDLQNFATHSFQQASTLPKVTISAQDAINYITGSGNLSSPFLARISRENSDTIGKV